MRKPNAQAGNGSTDWTALCAEAAVGGLGALAAVRNGALVRDPALRRLIKAVAAEAAAAARSAGHRLSGRPQALAERLCRDAPLRSHPWLSALRAGHATGAGAVFGPLLNAARRGGSPAPKLTVIAATLRRLERRPRRPGTRRPRRRRPQRDDMQP